MTLTVSQLHIHPVKSLGAIALGKAELTPRGLRFDRRFMVVDRAGDFLTQREHPRMATVWTEIGEGKLRLAAPDAGEVALSAEPYEGETILVRVWNSRCRAIAPSPEADRWLSQALGMDCRLVYMPEETRREVSPEYAGAGRIVSFADGYPVLVTTEASLAELNSRLERPIPMNRFRPNVVVAGGEPWAEDGWRTIAVGSVRLGLAKPCGRCQVTTTDQATGEVTGPEPLATLATYRESAEFGVRFGVNALPEALGTLSVGDAVTVLD